MSSDPNNGGTTKLSQAKTWLTKFRSSGKPTPSMHVFAAAEAAGFNPMTIQRARKEMFNIVITRPVNPGQWFWRFVEFEEVEDEQEGV